MANKSGWQGIIKYGTAGSTAATQLTNVEDLNYNTDIEKIETTIRGDGTTIPKKVETAVALTAEITWAMFEDTADAALTALRAAERTGAAVAIRTLSHSSGTGFDGDCILSMTHEMTLKGQSKYNFTASPTDSAGRTWLPNA